MVLPASWVKKQCILQEGYDEHDAKKHLHGVNMSCNLAA